jgi:DNA-directed RNA polymerase subunit H (RpoH/RPB5)
VENKSLHRIKINPISKDIGIASGKIVEYIRNMDSSTLIYKSMFLLIETGLLSGW